MGLVTRPQILFLLTKYKAWNEHAIDRKKGDNHKDTDRVCEVVVRAHAHEVELANRRIREVLLLARAFVAMLAHQLQRSEQAV